MNPFHSIVKATNGAASIRDKISSPVPLERGLSDDEFPIRVRGEGMARMLANDGSPVLPDAVPCGGRQRVVSSTGIDPDQEKPALPPRSTPHLIPSEIEGAFAREFGDTSRSDSNNSRQVVDKDEGRKKTTFRSVVKKLFRKRKPIEPEAEKLIAGQSHLSASPQPKKVSRDTPTAHGRSTSLPLTEYNRALRSHSIIPDEVELPQVASHNLQAIPEPVSTIGPLIPDYPPVVTHSGLAPRPSSNYVCKISNDRQDTIEELTTRSTTGLIDQHAHDSHDALCQSEESGFCRRSYLSGQPSLSTSNKENEAPEVHTTSRDDFILDPTATAPIPFNFGPLTTMKITEAVSLETRITDLEERHALVERAISQLNHGASENVKAETAFAICPIRQLRSESELSMVSPGHRVSMYQQSHNPHLDTISPYSNTYIHPSHPTTPDSNERHREYSRSGFSPIDETPTTPPSHIPQPSLVSSSHPPRRPSEQHPVYRGKHRSNSHTPYPPSPQSQTKNGKSLTTAHHYTALFNLINQEQTARMALEAQVVHLQEQLHTILANMQPSDAISACLGRSGSHQSFNLKEYERRRNAAASRHSNHKDPSFAKMEDDGLSLDGMPKSACGPPIHATNTPFTISCTKRNDQDDIDRIEFIPPSPPTILHAACPFPIPERKGTSAPKKDNISNGHVSKFSDVSEQDMSMEDIFETPTENMVTSRSGRVREQDVFADEVGRQEHWNGSIERSVVGERNSFGRAALNF